MDVIEDIAISNWPQRLLQDYLLPRVVNDNPGTICSYVLVLVSALYGGGKYLIPTGWNSLPSWLIWKPGKPR